MVATKDPTGKNAATPAEKQQPTQEQQSTQAAAVEHTPKREVESLQGVERTRAGRVYSPAVDIYETRDAVTIVADMPGVDENSIDVKLEKNVLTIYGRVEPWQPEGYTLAHVEYGVGDYQRSFTITNEIDWAHIEGTVKNGVLTLTLPKTGPVQAKRIEIKHS